MSEAWPILPLGQLTTKVGSGATPKGGALAYHRSGVPLVRSMNVVFRGFKREGLAFLNEEQASALRNVEVRAGDVLLNITGASIGRVTIAPQDMDGARVNQHVCIIRPNEDVDSRFLCAFFSSPDVQTVIGAENYGVTRQALTKQQIIDWLIPVPPLAEQKRIADKLDALLARVEACRERLDRVPGILKRFRQAVLLAAMSGDLTGDWRDSNPDRIDSGPLLRVLKEAHERAGGHRAGNAAAPSEDIHDLTEDGFPVGWSLTTLRELVRPTKPITYGILKPGPELSDGVPYVRVADFPDDCLRLTGIRRTSPAMDEAFKRSRLTPGDLLLSIRGTVGRLIQIPEELANANITQDSARLAIQPEVNSTFVLWFLRCELAQSRMRGAVKGVAVRGINIGDVRALQVPLPSLAEQDEIVQRIEALFAFADRVAMGNGKAAARAASLSPALLVKAFRGDLS